MDVSHRLVALLAAAALGAGGCAGEDEAAAPAPPTPVEASGDVIGDVNNSSASVVRSKADSGPGIALRAFVEAARAEDLQAMWALLTTDSRNRTGPTFREFTQRAGRDFVETVGGFQPGYEVSLSVRVTPTTGAAAVQGQNRDPVTETAVHDAFAAGAVKERGRWLLELLSPGALQLVSPDTQVASDRPVVVVGVESSAPIIDVGIWIDGRQYPSPAEGGSPTKLNLLAQPAESIGTGPHTLVAYASVADVGGVVPMANAWTFTSA